MSYRNLFGSSKEDELEVELINWNSNGKLGFSITGGIGSQHIRGDDGIYIKSIQEGGLVSWDGRIWVGDQLVAVKQGLDGERINLSNCTHETAGTILRKFCSGKRVVLIVKKSEVNLINWRKNDLLGFSIAGGVDREHIPGDSRIYITTVADGDNASKDGRMSVGDRLLGVKKNLKSKGMRSEDFFLMDKCNHDDAVNALQNARKGKHVILIISKNNNVNPRLRFDDPPEEKSSLKVAVNQQPFAFGQTLLPSTTLLPHVSSPTHSNGKMAKPILKHKESSKCSKVDEYDEGLGDISFNTKKPVRIKYISGEPITEEEARITAHDLTSIPSMNGWCNSAHTSETTNNVNGLPMITPKDTLNASTSSTSSTSSIYEYDSALSSMSSEDEARFLDFSNVAKTLPGATLSKPGHSRQNSRHIIEPTVFKSDARVSHFSRPQLNKDRMFSSTSFNYDLETRENSHENKKISHDNSTATRKEKENIDCTTEYFNKRYNISSTKHNIKQDLIADDFTQVDTKPIFNHVNTKHFVKTTRYYAL